MLCTRTAEACDWPLPLSAGQTEKEEEGRGERRRELKRVKGEQAGLGGWKEALYLLGMWSTSAGCCWVLDTASISLELSDTNIHK